MTAKHGTHWQHAWTAEEPLEIAYVHVPADAGTWVEAEVPGLEARDLGLAEATGGAMGVRHLRVAGGHVATGEWRANDVDFQFMYVLRGRISIETEDGHGVRLEVGGAAYQPALYRHRQYDVSPDFEAVEITAPATFDVIEGRNAELPVRAAGLDPRRTAVYTDDGEDNYVMAAGPRPFFKYRDLGTRGPTDERIHLHVVRATGEPGEGTGWHYHSMAQWFMILGGQSDIRVEGGPRTTLTRGDTMCIGAGPAMRHNVAPFSGDYAVLEMCVPATYETVPVEAPVDARR
jgi:quercetin dioxygenase-like cupin family protein